MQCCSADSALLQLDCAEAMLVISWLCQVLSNMMLFLLESANAMAVDAMAVACGSDEALCGRLQVGCGCMLPHLAYHSLQHNAGAPLHHVMHAACWEACVAQLIRPIATSC